MMDDIPKIRTQKKNWIEFVWHRVIEVVMAFLLFYAIIQFSDRIDERNRAEVPASAWFKVNEVYVPDHQSGSNPPVIYDRQILSDFRGFFVVEVQKKLDNGLWWSACSGSGVSDYALSDSIPNNTVEWDWFVSRPCPMAPGVYRLRTSWEMKRVDWPIKSVVSLSNEFRIY